MRPARVGERVDGAAVVDVKMEFEAVVRRYENELAVPAEARSRGVRLGVVANREGRAFVGRRDQRVVKARPGRKRSAHGLAVECNVENALVSLGGAGEIEDAVEKDRLSVFGFECLPQFGDKLSLAADVDRESLYSLSHSPDPLEPS